MSKQIYINLPVKSLARTTEFFTKLGFTFNPMFTNESGTGMTISDSIYVMFLTEEFFSTFTKKALTDATKSTEVINAISIDSREELNKMIETAIASGGNETKDPQDHGWMFVRSFEDLDGHQWELVHMDISKMPANPAAQN